MLEDSLYLHRKDQAGGFRGDAQAKGGVVSGVLAAIGSENTHAKAVPDVPSRSTAKERRCLLCACSAAASQRKPALTTMVPN